MDIYSSSGIEEAFDSLWNEFAAQKKAIVNWEKKMRRADKEGYEVALKVMKEINESLEASKPTDYTEMAYSIAPGVVADFADDSVGAGTAVEGAKKGLSFIRRWKQRTRITYFNNGKKEAGRIKNQGDLLMKAFGNDLNSEQITRYLELTDSLQQLTRRSAVT